MISKRTWRIFLITLVIALPIRLYQALFLLEPETGFYSDGFLSTGALLIVLMAGCALLCAETAREKQMVPRLPVRSLGAAVAGMFTGFLFFGQSIYSLLGSPAVDNAGMNRILAAAGILAGAAFLWQSYGLASGGRTPGRATHCRRCFRRCGAACALWRCFSPIPERSIRRTMCMTRSPWCFCSCSSLPMPSFMPASSRRASGQARRALRPSLRVAGGDHRGAGDCARRDGQRRILTGYPFGMFLMNGAAASLLRCCLSSACTRPARSRSSRPKGKRRKAILHRRRKRPAGRTTMRAWRRSCARHTTAANRLWKTARALLPGRDFGGQAGQHRKISGNFLRRTTCKSSLNAIK